MKQAFGFGLLFYSLTALSQSSGPCAHWPSWFQSACSRLHQIWTEGSNDLYLTGYAWHNRYKYSPERVKKYNELAWGGGLGRGLYDEDGDWHGLYAFAFLDSHKNVEPIAGYAFLKTAHLNENLSIGGGLSAFVTARPDIFHGIPFPGVLPWASITYERLTLCATYIPGAKDAGNVLFLLAKWQF
jgi:palmitoyl transferase